MKIQVVVGLKQASARGILDPENLIMICAACLPSSFCFKAHVQTTTSTGSDGIYIAAEYNVDDASVFSGYLLKFIFLKRRNGHAVAILNICALASSTNEVTTWNVGLASTNT